MSKYKHNHDKCIEEALREARDICTARQTRFTALRQKVLELVWTEHAPVTAYELLDMLSNDGNKRVAPPTVYRALDFLMEEGFVHRLESLNAFIGCPDPSHKHQGHFLICRQCRRVTEATDVELTAHIASAALAHGYSCENSILEVMGLCTNCQP